MSANQTLDAIRAERAIRNPETLPPDTAARDAQRAFNARLAQATKDHNARIIRENVAAYQAADRAGLIKYPDPVALQAHQRPGIVALFAALLLALLPFLFDAQPVTTIIDRSPVVHVKNGTAGAYRNHVTRAALPATASLFAVARA